jgi:Arc/MetJ-type ribon-helix-helix transcriptional regulator
MAVQIAPSTENLIDEMVASGQYDDAADVIEHAVQLLRQWNHNQRIVASVKEASAAAHRGERFPLTDELILEIRNNAREADRLSLPIDPDVCP